MSRNKLGGIIIACTIAIIVGVAIATTSQPTIPRELPTLTPDKQEEEDTRPGPQIPLGKIIFARQGNLHVIDVDGTNEIEIERERDLGDNFAEKVRTVTPSPDGKMIVYQMRTDREDFWFLSIRSSVLYAVRTDGTEKVRLDKVENAYFENIGWSPDGKIVSYGIEKPYQPPDKHVFLDIDSGERFWLDAVSYQWSPDGRSIVYHHSDGDWRIRSREGSETKLGVDIYPPVRWSSDGRKIYYMEKPQGNLVSTNADGTGKTRLIPASIAENFEFVDVTPDTIIYKTRQPVDSYHTLWVADLEGANQRRIRGNAASWIIGEKKIIVFSGWVTTPTSIIDLRTMNTETIETRSSIVFSPDEQWIAYAEEDKWGDYYIYMVNLDTMTKTQLAEGSIAYGWVP